MKILFLSRAFPPTVGGIENQNRDLSLWLTQHATVRTIANHGGKKALPLFLPRVLIQSLFVAPFYDAILLGDGVLAPIGFILKLFFPRKTVTSVLHGLDITFATKPGLLARLYAALNIPCLRKLDLLITVSSETKETALRAGLLAERCIVINNGVNIETLNGSFMRADLEAFLGINLTQKCVILRTGRYVKHKGVEWFLRSVMPLLPDNVIFVAAGAVVKKSTPGDVDILPACQKAVTELGLTERVFLLTDVAWENMNLLYHTANIVVAPNISVPGTMEGFGIAVIEAALCGRPVVASNLQGLKDAIKDGENGLLVTPEDPLAFRDALVRLMTDDAFRYQLTKKAPVYTREHYDWDAIAKEYVLSLTRVQTATS